MSENDADTPKPLSLDEVHAIFDRSPMIAFMRLKVLAVDHDREEIKVTMPMLPIPTIAISCSGALRSRVPGHDDQWGAGVE